MTKIHILERKFKFIEKHKVINQNRSCALTNLNFIKKLSYERTCGQCVGAYLADIYKTPITNSYFDTYNGKYFSRFYLAGIKALHEDLMGYIHYYNYYLEMCIKRNYRYDDILSLYLHEYCNAPKDCFSDIAWIGIHPSEVFKKLAELNPSTSIIKQAA